IMPSALAGAYRVHSAPADQAALQLALAAQPSVRSVGPLHFAQLASTVPIDPDFTAGKQWDLNGANGINAPQAWDVTHGSTKVIVASIDTGLDYNQPDIYL